MRHSSLSLKFMTGLLAVAGLVAAALAPLARGQDNEHRQRLNSKNLGLNYPWVDDHQGHVQMLWMVDYQPELVENDLQVISELGVRIIRVFAPVDSVMSFDGARFSLVPRRAEHVDRLLAAAGRHELKVILVMADGNVNEPPQDLAGKFRWDLVQSQQGLKALEAAYVAYVQRFRGHEHVLMWEVANEPFGNLTWAAYPQKRGVTLEETHRYLKSVYQAVKPLTRAYVGFSELHEEQQEKYRLFSNADFRQRYIDDATDVYSMHIYRASPDQVPDFSTLRGKPKWCSELGSYNYVDETGAAHAGQPARGELWNERENLKAVTTILPKLLDGGFDLVLPWAFTSNEAVVVHRRDGSHELKALPRWMQTQLKAKAGDGR